MSREHADWCYGKNLWICIKCYFISNVSVKVYDGETYFSSSNTSEVKEITDIGAVCTITSSNEQEYVGEIIGIVPV